MEIQFNSLDQVIFLIIGLYVFVLIVLFFTKSKWRKWMYLIISGAIIGFVVPLEILPGNLADDRVGWFLFKGVAVCAALNLVWVGYVVDIKKRISRKKIVWNEHEAASAKELYEKMREGFFNIVPDVFTDDTLKFCRSNEEAAFGIYMSALYAMMMPPEDFDRKEIVSSKDSSYKLYQIAKKLIMGEKVLEKIVTPDDDKSAAEIFYLGLLTGEKGVSCGRLPTDFQIPEFVKK